jgi:magnesium transporter
MVGKILQPEIRSLIDARDFGALREIFREWPPADVAEVILDMPEDEQVIIFRVLPNALAADVFEYLDVEAQQKLLRAMAHEQVVGILNEMSPEDRTALLEEMPSAAARQLIKLLTPEERRVAHALLGYPEGSIGRLMTPDFIAVHDDWTVREVLDHVREFGHDSETLNVIYVVDERGKLIDDLRMREFLLRPLEAKVSDFRDRLFVALKVNDSQGEALNAFRKYDRQALPVVDSYHWLVALTVDSALVGVVLWGTISGAMLPFLLRRLGLDPATSSAPFVATLVDVTGLLIYFNVALFILRGTLL